MALIQLNAALRAGAVAVAIGLASPLTVSAQTEAGADAKVEVCPVPASDTLHRAQPRPCAKTAAEQIELTQAEPTTATRMRERLGRVVRLIERVTRVVRVKHGRPAPRIPRAVPAPKVGRPR
jgi:hypothetical protein